MAMSGYVQQWLMAGGRLVRPESIQDPAYYQKIPGWFDFQDIYDYAVQAASNNGLLVEVGCFYGRSTAYLASRVALSGKQAMVFGVDPWIGYQGPQPVTCFAEFMGNMLAAGVLDVVTPLRMVSARAARMFDDESVDFCFLDGDHTYEAVQEDLRTWYPKVRKGGLIGGHDYINAEHPGVRRAVDEFFPTPVQVSGISWVTQKSG